MGIGNPKSLRLKPSVVAALLLGAVICGHATEYVVSPGESIADKAKALKPGDVLLIKSGVHRQSVTLSGLKGSRKRPITISGEDGAVVEPTGRDGILFWDGGGSEYVIVEGLTVRGAQRAGLVLSGSKHITIRDCAFGDNGKWGLHTSRSEHITVERCTMYRSRTQHGIYFSTTDHPVVRGCRIYENAGCGIHMNGDKSEGGDGMISDGLIEANLIYGNGRTGGAAINMDGVGTTVVRHNVIYGNKAGGIVTFVVDGARAGSKNQFLNNTVYFRSGQGRYGLSIAGGRDMVVRNNILVCGRGAALIVEGDSVGTLTSDRNVFFTYRNLPLIRFSSFASGLGTWQQNRGQDSHSLALNPMFVDPKGGDFHLHKDSPALRLGAGALAGK